MKEGLSLTKGKILGIVLTSVLAAFLSGCKKIPILEEKKIDYVVEVSAEKTERDAFYVKNGTKFSKVYMPYGNASSEARVLDPARVLYFVNDEKMVPIHYKNESLAYKSSSFELSQKGVSLERFKDMGYSIGVYGGTVKEDGYYHFFIDNNLAFFSDIEKVFSTSEVDEIRIVSVGGKKPADIVDEKSGIFCGLEENKPYTVEFYVGTYYYSHNFIADTHFLKAYEYYYFDGSSVKDTKLSYMTFDTPTDLKSGYYNVNGSGVYKYLSFEKGLVSENVDLNESYYSSEKDQILQYTRQYNLSIPVETKDLCLSIKYGEIADALDEGSKVGGYLISPEGIVYDLDNKIDDKNLSISLQSAMPGNWTIGIYPRSLMINGIDTYSDEAKEETSVFEEEIVIDESGDYKAFYTDVYGDGDVYAAIIYEDGRTCLFEEVRYLDDMKNVNRYLVCKFPHLASGKYTVRIYYYKSNTKIENLSILTYDPQTGTLE